MKTVAFTHIPYQAVLTENEQRNKLRAMNARSMHRADIKIK